MLSRIFIRETEDFEYSQRQDRIKVGVVGMAHGAGASMIATAIAKELTIGKDKRIAFVEGIKADKGYAHLYDSLGMDRRFLGKTYINFFDEIAHGIRINGKINLDERINWALYLPNNAVKNNESCDGISSLKFLSLVNNIVADIVLCDLNDYAYDDEVLADMDALVFVIDPLPSRLIAGYERLCRIKKIRMSGKTTILVLNKDNPGINRAELSDCIRIKPDLSLPLLSSEMIYESEYNCKIPYSEKNINPLLCDGIHRIVELLEI